jgi:hypothetical protein
MCDTLHLPGIGVIEESGSRVVMRLGRRRVAAGLTVARDSRQSITSINSALAMAGDLGDSRRSSS